MKLSRAQRYFKNTLLHTCILIFGSCLTPIDIPSDHGTGKLVISGQISSIEEMSMIQVGVTAETDRLPIPVTDAFITLYDDLGGTYYYDQDPERPGIYLASLAGLPGRSYFIELRLPSGKVYQSNPETMPERVGTDSVYYKFIDEEYTDGEGAVTMQHFVKLYSTSTLPPSENPLFIRWSVHEDYVFSPTDFPDPFGSIPPSCFISQNADPQRIVLYNGKEVMTTLLPDLLLATRLADYSFHERHYFTIHQSSITADAFEYWRKVNLAVSQVGTIFDTPPATIPGNIYNVDNAEEVVLGYFQAVNQSQTRFFLLPTDLPFHLNPFCKYDNNRPFNDYPSICLDCTRTPNSSYRRPPWF